ncbi:MAG: hypothetical protein GY941_03725, partial [Planctomycetes bacterium]|nr:hypothetical protein [Planctomycetota bacterium]
GGVSAFEMTGTNAHMVVEENHGEEHQKSTLFPYYILPFSATTEESLRAQLKEMIQFLESEQLKEEQISQLSFTLLTGRHHWDHRCVLVVKDLEMVTSTLKQALSKEKLPYLFQNKVDRGFSEQKAMKRYIVELLDKSSSLINDPVEYQETLYGLADFYCQGYEIDWTLIFKGSVSQRIHLPTYLFSREQYWVSEKRVFEKRNQGSKYKQLNPLLHHNTSTLEEERFTSTFTGTEFFLNDHQVKGEKVLPGVGYLEMARTAVEKASGEREEGTTIHLKNIVWAQPIVVDGSAQKVHIGFFGEESGQIQFEVYTESDNEEELIVHSQGVAEFKEKGETTTLDIQNLWSQMNQETLNADNCYQAFKEMGIDYGEGHRGIREIYQGENQLLAKLSLPSSVQDTQSEYVLHPSLMDASFQSSIGLILNNGTQPNGSEASLKPSLPFALKSLEILTPCTSEMYAWVRHSDGCTPSDAALQLDIDICDEQGNVCMELRGVSYVIEKTTFEKKTVTRCEFLKSEEPSQRSQSSSLSPEEKIQKFLQQAVAEQLQKSEHKIQVDQSYFEIGIGSLGIVKVVKQLEALLDVELSPTLLFQYVNIQQLSAYVSQQFTAQVNSLIIVPQKVEIQQIKDSSTEDPSQEQNYKLLTPYKRKKRWVDHVKTTEIKQEEPVNIKKEQSLDFPLSEGEKGLWMLQIANPSMSAYNVPVCYQISGNIILEYLEKAWAFVQEQYPLLKARIYEKDGIPYHYITDECKTTIQEEHISIQDNKELLFFLKEQVKQPFNIEQGPLTRIQVFFRKDQDAVLLITIHHIVSDGTSVV